MRASPSRLLTSHCCRPAAALLVAGLLAAAPAGAIPLDCTSMPAGAPAYTLELVTPSDDGLLRTCEVEIVGSVFLEEQPGWDVYIVVDSSGSTAGASGIDIDGDGLVGTGDWRANTDPADSTLDAELEAVRRALDSWEGLDVRVALEEYSAQIPIPPGEPSEQGRIRTVQGLTSDFAAVRAGLDTIRASQSVGATDYGGALLELAAEYDRSGDPSRRPVAFFLSDGKPTFPRFPFDATEPQDVAWALEGARAVALRGLPVNTLEIGVFDDIGVLSQVADITGGTLLPGLVGQDILDAISGVGLDGFVYVQLRNESSGETRWAVLEPGGNFSARVPLQNGENDLTFTVILRTPEGEWTLSCPLSLRAFCDRRGTEGGATDIGGAADSGLGDVDQKEVPWWWPRGTTRNGRGGVDGGDTGGGLTGDTGTRGGFGWRVGGEDGGLGGDGGYGGRYGGLDHGGEVGDRRRRLDRRPETRDRLGRWGFEPCPGLSGEAGQDSTDCDEAARQLTALLISLEVGDLTEDCPLDRSVMQGRETVGEVVAELEAALDAGDPGDCAAAAALGSRITDGSGLEVPLQGPDPTGPATFECELLQDGTDVDITVSLSSPAPGSEVGGGSPCNALLSLAGDSSARGNAAYDVYFVIDSSGSTAGDSGRDLDADGTNEDTLEVELAAVRAFVDRLDPALVRVALVEFSAEIPIPPGEPSEQGRIRTVHSLSSDFNALFASFDVVRAAGSVGATDYGGALLELAAEYDRNGDPSRGHVAFFLSDGKPTFPRYPYDTTEPADVIHALDGADACAARGIVVNTFEVGVFDDLSTLEDVANRTGGVYYASLSDGAIVDALPGSSLVGIESVEVQNLLTGETVQADLAPDGSFEVEIELAPGENSILILVTSDNGEEVVQCTTTFVGDCTLPTCEPRTPESWREEDCP